MAIKTKAQDSTRYDTCPKCGGVDIKGPIDSTPKPPYGHFTRAWFCRTCWWDADVKLRDEKFAGAATD